MDTPLSDAAVQRLSEPVAPLLRVGQPAGILRISAPFDVTETDISRPPMFHWNLRTDGIEKVWKSILETEVPPLPPLAELADPYGDFESDKLHPVPGSVHELLRDRYWRENPTSYR